MPDSEESTNSPKSPDFGTTIRSTSDAFERFARISESIGRDLVVRNDGLRTAIEAMSKPNRGVEAIQKIVEEGRLFSDLNVVSEISRRRFAKFNEALEVLQKQRLSQFQKLVDDQEQLFQNTALAISRSAKVFDTLDGERIAAVLEAAYSSAERELSFDQNYETGEYDQDERVTILVFSWVVNSARTVGIFDPSTIASIFVTVVLTLYSLNTTHDDITGIAERLDALVESVESTGDIPSNQPIIVTTADLNLRNEPTINADIVTVLQEGEEAEVIRSEGAWFYLKYIDVSTDEVLYGWAHSAYTRSSE